MEIPRSPSRPAAFTLLELLIVVAIIAFMAIITLPNITSTLRGSQITQGGQLLESQLQVSRQMALAENRTVEMRFYSFSPITSGSSHFTAFQSFFISASGTSATPVDKVFNLPGNLIMDAGNNSTVDDSTTLSTLLARNSYSPSQLLSPTSLPSAGTNYHCVTFQFRPDGSTNLQPIGTNWFITVHAGTDGDNIKPSFADSAGAKPVNYYTIQIDPYNGHIYEFHP